MRRLSRLASAAPTRAKKPVGMGVPSRMGDSIERLARKLDDGVHHRARDRPNRRAKAAIPVARSRLYSVSTAASLYCALRRALIVRRNFPLSRRFLCHRHFPTCWGSRASAPSVSSSPRPRRTGQASARWTTCVKTAGELRAANWKLQRDAGHRPDPVQRLLALRPGAGHDRDGRGGAGALRLGRLERRRPRHLLRDGARPPDRRRRRDRDGDDEVVRHQLPLHRARARARHEVPLLLAQAARALPGGEGRSASRPSRCWSGRSPSCCRASARGEEFDRLELLDDLVDVYAEVLAELGKLGRRVGADRRARAGRGPHTRGARGAGADVQEARARSRALRRS